jgi:hypothetical protein
MVAASDKYERALRALAVRFEERHGDRWLRDLLVSSKPGKRLTQGLVTLSEAVRANLADESDRAMAKSAEAADELRAAASPAAAVRADHEKVYAFRRAVRLAADCVQKGATLELKASPHYPWIAGQALLEQGNCRSLLGNFDAAQKDMARALELIRGVSLRYEGVRVQKLASIRNRGAGPP